MDLIKFYRELKTLTIQQLEKELYSISDDVIAFGFMLTPRADYISPICNTVSNLEKQSKGKDLDEGKRLKWDVNEWDDSKLEYLKELSDILKSESESFDFDDPKLESHIYNIYSLVTDLLLELKKEGHFNVFKSEEFFLMVRSHEYYFTEVDAIPIIKLLGVKGYNDFFSEYVVKSCSYD